MVFITHLHGDHLNGLPGAAEQPLLSSRIRDAPRSALMDREYLDSVFRITSSHLEYELIVTELSPVLSIEDVQYRVEADLLEHRVPSWGFRVMEKDRQGTLDAAKAKSAGRTVRPLLGQLKGGRDVQLPVGASSAAATGAGPDVKGRIVTILGDTVPCPGIQRLAQVRMC